jgi:hypothetical protein
LFEDNVTITWAMCHLQEGSNLLLLFNWHLSFSRQIASSSYAPVNPGNDDGGIRCFKKPISALRILQS